MDTPANNENVNNAPAATNAQPEAVAQPANASAQTAQAPDNAQAQQNNAQANAQSDNADSGITAGTSLLGGEADAGNNGMPPLDPNAQPDPDNVVPDQYEIDLPDEGFFKDADAGEVQKVFKEAKLTKKQAAILWKNYKEDIQDLSQAKTEQIRNAFAQQVHDWRAQINADPELGGQNYAQTKLNIGRVMEKFGTPELRQYLNSTQLGYHPELVRFVARIGKAIGDDRFVGGNGGAQTVDPVARDKRLFPKSPELWGK